MKKRIFFLGLPGIALISGDNTMKMISRNSKIFQDWGTNNGY
jgi:hypothetical protein